MEQNNNMLYDNRINNLALKYGVIKSSKLTLQRVCRAFGESVDNADRVVDSLETADIKVEMYDFGLNTTENKNEAKYIVLNTGIKNKGDKEVCLLSGRGNKDVDFILYYIGNKDGGIKTMVSSLGERITEDYEHLKDIVTKILEIAMYSEELKNKDKIYGVMRCIKARIEAYIKGRQKQNEQYTFSKDRSYVMYNTGILDSYGNYVMLAGRMDDENIKDQIIISSKILMEKFKFAETNIEPVSLYDNTLDLVFQGKYEDIDIEASNRIEHIIKERANRFPKQVQKMSDKKIYDSIKSSIDFDLRMYKRDTRWILPFYNIKFDEIQYLFPLFLMSDYKDTADLALVVRKQNDMYMLCTVLTVEKAYINASALGETNCRWMINGGN